jgi:hypothetical protein
MKGERAESNALGHSSCGRCPHPDIVIILCTSKKQWVVKNTCQTKSSPYKNHEQVGADYLQNLQVSKPWLVPTSQKQEHPRSPLPPEPEGLPLILVNLLLFLMVGQ